MLSIKSTFPIPLLLDTICQVMSVEPTDQAYCVAPVSKTTQYIFIQEIMIVGLMTDAILAGFSFSCHR